MRHTRPNPTSTELAFWPATRRAVASAALFSATIFACLSVSAQTVLTPPASTPSAYVVTEDTASLDLPDAPGVLASSSASDAIPAPSAQDFSSSAASSAGQGSSSLPEAPRTQRYPLVGQPAPVLTAGDKVRMGITGAVNLFSIVGWVTGAGYEQLTNGSPNWGTDRGAFGQRLWCSAARATSENLFSDSIFAPMLHEDPRYYTLGPTHKFIPRVVYAATRSIITRSDSGATVPNLSQIFGNAAGSALTYVYYPQSNQTAKDTAETFGSSIGGTALGDVIAEFFGRILYNHQR